jgi:hypothetical protein
MTFPNVPYPGYSWPLTQHVGVLSSRTLYALVYAAATYAGMPDPSPAINSYLVANNILPPNVRSDSGQADIWRDYQQILSELGLMFSTTLEKDIRPTPIGLAFLDGAISFSELVTLQALRYQYPNGHKTAVSPELRRNLNGTPFTGAETVAELQFLTGVKLRPAVLVWDVLRQLQREGEQPVVTCDELQAYFLRCSTHDDTAACVKAIIQSRRGGATMPPVGETRERRNMQDWIKFLLYTPLFTGDTRQHARLGLSRYADVYASELDGICAGLVAPSSFWSPRSLDALDRRTWYASYGTLDLSVGLMPTADPSIVETGEVGPTQKETDAFEDRVSGSSVTEIRLRPFDPASFGVAAVTPPQGDNTIVSAYDAALAGNKHRLHDLMVLYVADTCARNGARVWDDPNSLDLLVEHNDVEYIVEVKTVTQRNFVNRLRYALGQVIHYDYLRGAGKVAARRKVVGVTAYVPPHSWSISFLNDFLDIDLLCLDKQVLTAYSRSSAARGLFTPVDLQRTLPPEV